MKKQHTIINANDIHAALAGEHVEPFNAKQEAANLWKKFDEQKEEKKMEAKKTTRKTSAKKTATTKKAPAKNTTRKTTKKNIAREVCQQLCFCFEIKPEVIYFKGIDNMADLKKKYKELAAEHHPDRGGLVAVMARINAEYDAKVKELAGKEKPAKHTTDAADGMTDEEIAAAIAEEFKATLEKLMALNLDGVKVELIGSWLWVSGNTKPIKDELKALKFRWCPKKDGQPWAWHDSYTYYPSSKGRSTKEDIENKYGVEELKSA